MRVHFIWPKCEFNNQKWGAKGPDAFFVQCTPDETDREVLGKITVSFDAEKLQKDRAANGVGFSGCSNKDEFLYGEYFLVSRDLSSVVPSYWGYPISGQWNSYSPFIAFEAEIPNLEALQTLETPPEVQKVIESLEKWEQSMRFDYFQSKGDRH